MASIFHEAAMMDGPRIAGVRLHPLSPWHCLCLTSMNNAYFTDADVTTKDLFEVLLICCDKYEDRLRTLLAFTNSFFVKCYWFMRLIFRNEDKMNLEVCDYLTTYLRSVEYWDDDKEEKRSGVPWPFAAYAFNRTKLANCSEAEAWNMAVNKVCCLRSYVDEQFGAQVAENDLMDADRILADAPEPVRTDGNPEKQSDA